MTDNLNKQYVQAVTKYTKGEGLVLINDPTPMQGFSFFIFDTYIIVFKSDTYEVINKVPIWQKINLEENNRHEKIFSFNFRMHNYLAVYDRQYLALFMITGTNCDPERDFLKLNLTLNENILKVYYLPCDVRKFNFSKI
jgi:hypothetical protein